MSTSIFSSWHGFSVSFWKSKLKYYTVNIVILDIHQYPELLIGDTKWTLQ